MSHSVCTATPRAMVSSPQVEALLEEDSGTHTLPLLKVPNTIQGLLAGVPSACCALRWGEEPGTSGSSSQTLPPGGWSFSHRSLAVGFSGLQTNSIF